jgi:DNA segregation ATPase FtsK/SpoIIIE-like protein
MDDLEARGIVGPEDGVKPRKVTMTREEFRELYG